MNSAVALNKTETIFESQTDFIGTMYFSERQLTNFESCVHKESFIATIYRGGVAVLVIIYAFPCSGITGGVQLEGGALFFNFPLDPYI